MEGSGSRGRGRTSSTESLVKRWDSSKRERLGGSHFSVYSIDTFFSFVSLSFSFFTKKPPLSPFISHNLLSLFYYLARSLSSPTTLDLVENGHYFLLFSLVAFSLLSPSVYPLFFSLSPLNDLYFCTAFLSVSQFYRQCPSDRGETEKAWLVEQHKMRY